MTCTSRRQRATAALAAVALLMAGCGNAHRPGAAGSGSTQARFLAYSRCMRSHGISDFPDPTTVPGGGVAFQIDGGPDSDLNQSDPDFRAATRACRAVSPVRQGPPASGPKIAAEVRWARCLRSHGVPSFPDPSRDGAFDSSRFQPASPAFQSAGRACKSVQPSGAVAAAPGPG
jgi:hypothetical protein